MLVEDEHSTEFKFSDAIPGTLGHSGTIGKIKAAIGDRDRIGVDAAERPTRSCTRRCSRPVHSRTSHPCRAPRASRTSNSYSPWSTCACTVPS